MNGDPLKKDAHRSNGLDAADSPEASVSLANWDTYPFSAWAFQNMERIFPTAKVSRGNAPVTRFDHQPSELGEIDVPCVDGKTSTVGRLLEDTDTHGFLVLRDGQIIFEQYAKGLTPQTLHLGQSLSKSVTGTLVGIYLDRGLIVEDKEVTDYVPELAASGYAGATIRQILDMRTGVKFVEDYTDPEAEFGLLDIAAGWKEPATGREPDTIRDLLVSIDKERDHGGHYQYRSIDNDVLAWVCERVGGAPFAELLGTELWSKLGAEHDANFTVDKAGTALADGGFSATLRDFGRFGQMYLDDGCYRGVRIVSSDWTQSCGQGDSSVFGTLYPDYLTHYPNSAYSNQWWVIDSDRGMFSARGVFGQLICIDPGSRLVVVKLSGWPTFLDFARTINTYRMVEAIAEAM